MKNKMTLLTPIVVFLAFAGCTPHQPTPLTPPPGFSGGREHLSAVTFPQLPSLDASVYANIQQTCRELWLLDSMKMDTFTVAPDRDEYLVKCDGVDNGELYSCTIRVDGNGKWINDGRMKKNP